MRNEVKISNQVHDASSRAVDFLLGFTTRALIKLASLLVLARLIEPRDFGIIAVLSLFIAFSDWLRDLGLQHSVLRQKDFNSGDLSNLFFMNIILGLLSSIIIIICSLTIPMLAKNNEIKHVAWSYALASLFYSLSSVFRVKMILDLRYRVAYLAENASQGVALIVAIVLALQGWGYKALLAQVVIDAILMLVLRVAFAGWTPGKPRFQESAVKLLQDGIGLAFVNLINVIHFSFGTFMLGIRFNFEQVGLFSRSSQLLLYPYQTFVEPLASFILPEARNKIRKNQSPESIFSRIDSLLTICGGLLGVTIFTHAEFIIKGLLGEKWIDASSTLAILSLGLIFQFSAQTSLWRELFNKELAPLLKRVYIARILGLSSIASASLFSLNAVAIAYVFSNFLFWVVMTRYSSSIKLQSQILKITQILIFMTLSHFISKTILDNLFINSKIISFLVSIIFVILIYLSCIYVFPSSRRMLNDGINIVRQIVSTILHVKVRKSLFKNHEGSPQNRSAKVFIVTFPPNSNANYGGIIQSWALQTYLQEKAIYAVVVTSTKPTGLSAFNRILFESTIKYLPRSCWNHLGMIQFKAKRVLMLKLLNNFIKSRMLVDALMSKSQRISPESIPVGSFVIFGSDQIWRKSYGRYQTYFGDFISENKSIYVCSYGASFGGKEEEYSPIEIQLLKDLLKRFDLVSVREKSASLFLKMRLDKRSSVVPDPTLLLSKLNYLELISDIEKSSGDYFFYLLDNSPIVELFVGNEFLLVETEIRVASILGYEFNRKNSKVATYELSHPSVENWIACFSSYGYVITDSFHGVVFSVIFNKPFVFISNAKRGDVRIRELLQSFGLESQMISDFSQISETLDFEIDWNSVNLKIKHFQRLGEDFLDQVIKNTELDGI